MKFKEMLNEIGDYSKHWKSYAAKRTKENFSKVKSKYESLGGPKSKTIRNRVAWYVNTAEDNGVSSEVAKKAFDTLWNDEKLMTRLKSKFGKDWKRVFFGSVWLNKLRQIKKGGSSKKKEPKKKKAE